MAYETLLIESKDQITTITLNRPKSKNAMNPQMHFDMCDALAGVERDDDCRVLVITGAGDSFCAGMDVKEYFYDTEEKPAERAAARKAAFEWMFKRLRLLPKPTIAAVNGWCFGGALAWLAVCDFAIASEKATFGLSEVNWGILPGALVSKAVADTVLPRHALYYACLGEPFDGKEAARIGMVNFAVPKQDVEAKTVELAEKLMKKSPAVLRATKQAIRHVRNMDFGQAYDYLAAKGQAIKVGDSEDSYNTGMRQFLDEKSYKPTFEPFKLGTMIADQRQKQKAK